MKISASTCLAAVVAAVLPTVAKAQTQLIINEIMPENLDMFIDPSFNYGGWVEFYNPTETTFSFNGLYVSDDSLNLKQLRLTSKMGTIEPGGFGNLWFDNYSKTYPGQVDMKLDIKGGNFYLSDDNGTIICQASYPEALPRVSWARTEDGGDNWSYSSTPTPNASNAGASFASEILAVPEIDKTGKVFTKSFTIKAQAPEGAQLYYTLNGSTPTPANSIIQEDGKLELTITNTTVIRLRSFKEGMLPSPVVTRSYINRGYESTLPVISVVTDYDGIWNKKIGIYVKGPNGVAGNGETDKCNWNQPWERAVNFELIVDDTISAINQEVYMSICGGWSRSNATKSFKLKAAKEFNTPNYLPYPVFKDKPFNRNKTLQNRNGGNESGMITDASLQSLVASSGLDVDCQEYQPAIHYIDGKFKGVINIREPNNKHFVLANYALDEDEIDMFEMNTNGQELQCGTLDAFNKMVTLSKNAKTDSIYQKILTMIDIDEFLNYMAVEMYLGNWDWPQNNLKAWRPRTEDGKFRFILYDLEQSFNTTQTFSMFDGKKYYTFGTSSKEIKVVTLFLNLMKNATFKSMFADRVCLISGSVFEPSRAKKMITEMAKTIENDMRECGKYSDVTGDYNALWGSANNTIGSLGSSRQYDVIAALQSWVYLNYSSKKLIKLELKSDVSTAGISGNGFNIPTGKFSGYVFSPMKVKAIEPAGYKFVGWYDANGNLISEDIEYSVTKKSSLIASYKEVEDDITVLPVKVNEVSADNASATNELFKREDWIELYNNTAFSYDVAGMYLSDDSSEPLKFQIPDTLGCTVIPAYGHLVIWCDKKHKEAVNQIHTSFKLAKEGGVVILTAADKSWCDSLVYQAHGSTQTVGLYPDGGTEKYLMFKPTPGNKNIITYYDIILQDLQDDPSTAVEETIIERESDGTMYDLMGRRITSPQRGMIYIKDGKKYLYKGE